jgi:hypothetical protein
MHPSPNKPTKPESRSLRVFVVIKIAIVVLALLWGVFEGLTMCSRGEDERGHTLAS